MATLDQLLVVGLLAVTLALFWTEWLRAELVALFVMVTLMVFGLVTPAEGVSGFSNSATVTVLALFIVSAGVYKTGLITWVGRRLSAWVGGSQLRILVILVLIAGPTSAFLNNTAIVAILLPLAMALAAEARVSPSKVLMPLSQIAMLAGTVTLIGTSTNVLSSSLVAERTGEGFGMFEFSRVGLIVFAAGAAYILLAGRFLLPERIPAGATGEEAMLQDFVTEFRVRPDSPLAGKAAIDHAATARLDVFRVLRDGSPVEGEAARVVLGAGDVVAVSARRKDLAHLEDEAKVDILSAVRPDDIIGPTNHIVEVVAAPSSSLVRRTLTEGRVAREFGVKVLGMRTSRPLQPGFLFATHLSYGDTLLVLASDAAVEKFRADPDFIVTEATRAERLRPRQVALALGIVTGVVAIAALGILPILVASLLGAVLMVTLRVLEPDDLWTSVRWDVIFLLAGMIPLGIAIENTGLAAALGGAVAGAAMHLPDVGIIAVFYVASMLLTAIMSNNGTVVLLIPIAFATAAELGVTPIPLALAIMFASSNDFNTPIGYQTNLMVYGPGGYRFSDYVRVGAPLSILLTVVTSLALLHFFPLR